VEPVVLPEFFFLTIFQGRTYLWYDGEDDDHQVASYTGDPTPEQVLQDAETYLGR
jgi:hypothetical protein